MDRKGDSRYRADKQTRIHYWKHTTSSLHYCCAGVKKTHQ